MTTNHTHTHRAKQGFNIYTHKRQTRNTWELREHMTKPTNHNKTQGQGKHMTGRQERKTGSKQVQNKPKQ